MPKINMNVWKHRVSHTCLHALREAGYRKPKDIAYVRVSSLLQIPELDANDVTSTLSALYDTIYKRRIFHDQTFSLHLRPLGDG